MKNTRLAVFVVFLMGFLFCSSGLILSQQANPQEVNTLYRQGLLAYQGKDYAGFLAAFKKLHELRPTNTVFLFNVAGGYSLTKQPDKAVATLKKLIVLDANRKIGQDSDFENIRETPGYKDVWKQIEAAWKPISNSQVAFTVKEKDLHLEGMAYDPVKKRFYLSSVHKQKIVYIDEAGKVQDFTTEGQDGLDAVLGMTIDAKKRILWASSNALPHMKGFKQGDRGRTGVFKYNLDTKKLVNKYVLNEGPRHGFDEVVLHPSGDVYVSDRRAIYRVTAKTDKLELFLTAGKFQSLQGIAFCEDGEKMVVADYGVGLFVIDVEKKAFLGEIKHADNVSLIGIDGFYYCKKNRSFIAVQSGIKPMRVLELFLDKKLEKLVKIGVIDKARPEFDEPTLGVLVENAFYYIANSQWQGYKRDFSIFPMDKLKDIIILKAPLKPAGK